MENCNGSYIAGEEIALEEDGEMGEKAARGLENQGRKISRTKSTVSGSMR